MIIFSISSSPGNFGTKMYNFLFEKHGLPIHYQTIKIMDQAHLESVLNFFELSDEIRGMSVSMPFKEKVAKRYQVGKPCGDLEIFPQVNTLNTLVKDSGVVSGYSTDVAFFSQFRKCLPLGCPVTIYGSGSMAKLAEYYFAKYNHPISKLTGRSAPHDNENFLRDSPVAFINATPAIIDSWLSDTSSVPFLLDLPVRHDLLSWEKRPGWMNGVTCAMLQFQYQFLAYTGSFIDMVEIESAYQTLFH